MVITGLDGAGRQRSESGSGNLTDTSVIDERVAEEPWT
jgi:hypothetical protein